MSLMLMIRPAMQTFCEIRLIFFSLKIFLDIELKSY